MVMGKLDRLAVGKKFDVDFTGPKERGVAADESEHSAIGRERGVDGGIGEKRELLPIFFCGRRSGSDTAAKNECTGNTKENDGGNAGKDVEAGTAGRSKWSRRRHFMFPIGALGRGRVSGAGIAL